MIYFHSDDPDESARKTPFAARQEALEAVIRSLELWLRPVEGQTDRAVEWIAEGSANAYWLYRYAVGLSLLTTGPTYHPTVVDAGFRLMSLPHLPANVPTTRFPVIVLSRKMRTAHGACHLVDWLRRQPWAFYPSHQGRTATWTEWRRSL